MSLSKSIKNLKTDKRLYTLNVKMGEIDPQNHETYLQSLEDLSSKSKKLAVEGALHAEPEGLNGQTPDMN